MKTRIFLISMMLTLFGVMPIFSQKTYVDSKGHLHVEDTIIGKISKGKLTDNAGQNIAHISKEGMWVDSKGTLLGKPPKNGQLIYMFEAVTDTFDISAKIHNGMCKITNSKGETILLLHNKYKQEATCAIHCLYINHCLPYTGKK